jgi:hypothetical protein
MEQQAKIGTLKEMTEQSFLNRPEQAPEAIEEYLKNIDPLIATELTKKLSNVKYMEEFKVAITHTSLMVFIAAFKVAQDNIPVDFEQYIREFLFFARQDDKEIFNMRTFYLSNLDATEMGIGEIGDSPEEQVQYETPELEKEAQKAIENAKNSYNQLISSLLIQYRDTKIHL